MGISRKIYTILKRNLSFFKIDFFKFLFKEFIENISFRNFFSFNLDKKKNQILFDNFETVDHFAYRFVILKSISNLFNLKIKYFNLGKNLNYFLIYSSIGASNISFFFLKSEIEFQ